MDCKCVGAFVAVLLSHACAVFATAGSDAPPLPDKVLPFVEHGRTVIAYQSSSADKLGETNIVFVTRLLIPSEPAGAATHPDEYICELIALRDVDGDLRVTGRTMEAVECVGNDKNLGAAFRELDDNLRLNGDEFTFTNYSNSVRWGWFSYSFRYDAGRWFASGAKASWTSWKDGFYSEVDESIQIDDIGLLYIEDFTQDRVQQALNDSRKDDVDYEGLVDTAPPDIPNTSSLRSAFLECTDRSGRDLAAVRACSEAELAYQDERLNESYRRLMRSLGDESKDLSRKEQRRWISARDSFCSSSASGREAARHVVATCHMYQTARRADILDARLKGVVPLRERDGEK